ncbi:MAG: LLM class flavin-dependent oxidoreductase [Alphaproteobacteria bacterium]|nr:LLM class flavin-dependent oxidoreductase [Alphaproteobacteria bacterium]
MARRSQPVVYSQRRGEAGKLMKVGVLQFFSWPGRRGSLPEVYDRALERIAIMDRGGFDAVWLAEHHFTTYSVCPSVHMLGTLAAARTTRLRIGTAVSLAALYHPLRLAEEVALLDMLSGGRVNWGAGRGFAASEFDAFGVPMEESAERFREAVEIVLQAWTQERLTYRGRHFSFDGVEVLPKPLQAPHPPTWMAATSESAIDWAASRGFSILMDPHSTTAELGGKRRRYADKLAQAGFSDAGRDIPMARLLALAPTAAEARAVAERSAQWLVDSYAGPQHAHRKSLPRVYIGGDPVGHYVDHVILHGTPASVVAELARLRAEIGLNYLMAAPLSRDTFRLLADEVLPRL